MNPNVLPITASPTTSEAVAAGLADARARTLSLVAPLSTAEIEAVHSTLMSPLAWDLGHIAAFEDLWLVHRAGGEPMLREELGHVYDAFETPRADRGELPFLGHAGALDYLAEVRRRVLALLERDGAGDGAIHELVIRHEMQHTETMLQAIGLARLHGYQDIARAPAPDPGDAAGTHSGLELVAIPAGDFELGAHASGFAYDNERPRHPGRTEAFLIGVTPVTNATYRHFVEGGGYERREWWTDEAWSWKEEYDITHPLHWTDDGREWRMGRLETLKPDHPVVHVSWFEADAFARAHDARLPTESEWEKAATWVQETGETLAAPWGDGPAVAGEHGNVDQRVLGTAAVGAHPAGASPSGCLGMVGDVWEWTASEFDGYPGFRAHPYPEYSEVFFRDGYRALRGGSWATRARVVTPTFRNWDLPQRRQIFAGVRIARDAT
jgi:iron(II)-dependent oxidoreductase